MAKYGCPARYVRHSRSRPPQYYRPLPPALVVTKSNSKVRSVITTGQGCLRDRPKTTYMCAMPRRSSYRPAAHIAVQGIGAPDICSFVPLYCSFAAQIGCLTGELAAILMPSAGTDSDGRAAGRSIVTGETGDSPGRICLNNDDTEKMIENMLLAVIRDTGQ
jgi:hypothetical protein